MTQAPPAGSATRFEFGDFSLDTGQRVLFRGAERIPLPKLTYDLLLALVQAAPNLLTHDDLVARVWRGRFVTPETLAQRVLLLRKALRDDSSNPRYLRARRGHGYQLLSPVRARGGDARRREPSLEPGVRDTPPGEHDTAAGGLDLSLPAQPSIVILPFESSGDDSQHGDFARGLAHDIMTKLGRTRSFFVIARGSAFRFGPGPHDVRDVGRKLGVRYVAQGYVRLAGSRISVDVTLADAVDGKEIWAERFSRRRLDSVFELQEEITALIVSAISTEVELVEQRTALLDATANLDAWSAYHRGCWHMYRFTAEDYDRAQHFFELSAKLDPSSSRALAGLSFVYWQRAFLDLSSNRNADIQRAFEHAERSVAFNARDPLAHWALGRAHLLRGDLGESIAELDLTTTLNPSFAVGQYTLGFVLMQAGELALGIERSDAARRLSPYDPMTFAMVAVRGFSLAMSGQYDEGSRLMRDALRHGNVHHHIVAIAALCHVLAGDDARALRTRERLRKTNPAYGPAEFFRAFHLQKPAHAKLVRKAFRDLELLGSPADEARTSRVIPMTKRRR